MNQIEKCELLRKSIEQLYTKEGRSRVYISELLGLNRKVLSSKINEWNLEEPEPQKYIKPSIQKYINKNRELIKSRLDKNISIVKIAEELKVSREFLSRQIIAKDGVLLKAKNDYTNRLKINAQQNKENSKKASYLNYDFEDLENEEWSEILGFKNYYVSNMGRVKHYIARYDSYVLLKPTKNNENGRIYISISQNSKNNTLNLARLVGHSFCEGFSDEKNTINHKDGNIENNCAENLEWLSQSENLKHSYDKLNRQKNRTKPLNYYILYKDTYKFKTITAFAKFLNKSWSQTKRMLEKPEKYDIKLIQK